jgi:hypothetical protein
MFHGGSHDVWVEDSRKDISKKRDAAERELEEEKTST